ncbi:MAG TPA: hypothetical protein VK572_17190 [Burkholderiales bacterium]|nr:hypothetical protein [Burkholderiales bacterium]
MPTALELERPARLLPHTPMALPVIEIKPQVRRMSAGEWRPGELRVEFEVFRKAFVLRQPDVEYYGLYVGAHKPGIFFVLSLFPLRFQRVIVPGVALQQKSRRGGRSRNLDIF